MPGTVGLTSAAPASTLLFSADGTQWQPVDGRPLAGGAGITGPLKETGYSDAGPAVGAYAAAVLDHPLPWTKMREAYALLGLVKRWGPDRVEAACGCSACAGGFRIHAVLTDRSAGRRLGVSPLTQLSTMCTGRFNLLPGCPQAHCPSCCSRPTTIPGEMPISIANAAAAAGVRNIPRRWV